MFYTYVIRNPGLKLYTGHTSDIERRLTEHNSGLSPYTKGKGPWTLFYYETYETRGEAMKREKFLKSGKGREFLSSLK